MDWQAPNVGSVTQYVVSRAEVTGGAVSLDDFEQIGTVNATTFSLVDDEELPNGVEFTYVVQAVFSDETVSGASNADTVTAVNDPPLAIADSFSVKQGVVLTVPARGVLSNDKDADSPPASLAAVAAQGPSHGALTLNANGSFNYTPAAGFSGQDSFTYQAYNRAPDGRLLSARSNAATVSITVTPSVYGFINVKNLPPAHGVTFKPSAGGTPVGFAWKFTVDGVLVSSADSQPSVTITKPSGAVDSYFPGCLGSAADCYAFSYSSSSKLWTFDWKPRNAKVGTYYVIVRSGKTGSVSLPRDLDSRSCSSRHGRYD